MSISSLQQIERAALSDHYLVENIVLAPDFAVRAILIDELAGRVTPGDLAWAGFIWSETFQPRSFMAVLRPDRGAIGQDYKACDFAPDLRDHLARSRVNGDRFVKVPQSLTGGWSECPVRGKASDHWARALSGDILGLGSADRAGWLVAGAASPDVSTRVILDLDRYVNEMHAESSRVAAMSESALRRLAITRGLRTAPRTPGAGPRAQSTDGSIAGRETARGQAQVDSTKAAKIWKEERSTALFVADVAASDRRSGHPILSHLHRSVMDVVYDATGSKPKLLGISAHFQGAADVVDFLAGVQAVVAAGAVLDRKVNLLVFNVSEEHRRLIRDVLRMKFPSTDWIFS